MTRPIEDVDVRAAVLEVHMADQRAIACLLVARVRSNSPSDQLAYAFDVRLIETHADVAVDADYPGWADHIAALQNSNLNARKEGP